MTALPWVSRQVCLACGAYLRRVTRDLLYCPACDTGPPRSDHDHRV